jgi:DNA-binding NtrC family response regulator
MGIFSAAIELLSNVGVSQQKRPLESSSDNEAKTKSTILVIDDDPVLLQTVKSSLVKRNVNVLTSSSARKGLEMIHYAPGDIRIVVLDYNMAKLSGDETLKFIRKRSPNARVVGLTDTNPDLLPNEDGYGVDKLLSKPVNATKLIGVIYELLGIETAESAAVQS